MRKEWRWYYYTWVNYIYVSDWYVSHSTAPRIVKWLGKGNLYFLCYGLWFVLSNGDREKSPMYHKQGYWKVVGNGTLFMIYNLLRSNQSEKKKYSSAILTISANMCDGKSQHIFLQLVSYFMLARIINERRNNIHVKNTCNNISLVFYYESERRENTHKLVLLLSHSISSNTWLVSNATCWQLSFVCFFFTSPGWHIL
jgi:hypothetical protein